MKKAHRRTIAAVLALTVVAVAIGLLTRHEKTAPMASAAARPPEPALRMRAWAPPAGAHVRADATEVRSPAQERSVRFIKDVFTDGVDVCANEPISVYVTASDDRPQPLPIYVKINGADGDTGVVTFAAPGEPSIDIVADDKHGTYEVRSVRAHVRDCAGSFQVARVFARAIPSRPDTYAFNVQPLFARNECARNGIVDPACASKPEPGDALSYAWDFGDGRAERTTEPYVEHDFADREQETLQSTFLVRVTVTSRVAGEIQGVTALTVPNLAYANKVTSGIVTPFAVAGTVTHSSDGYSFPVAFRSYEKTPLRLTKAKVFLSPCAASQSSTYDVSAAEILSATTVPPGKSEATLSLRGNLANADACAVQIQFEGSGFQNAIVHTSVGARLKPPVRQRLAEDDPRVAVVRDALRALGRESGPVSDEEIASLRQRGLVR